ncbi:MAG TPA: hypothetical protein VN743_00185, partial [Blastocatellia bacterium]|nr:hypothetical protein [Blastocatellia bacterium]
RAGRPGIVHSNLHNRSRETAESPGPEGRVSFIPTYTIGCAKTAESPGPEGRGLFIPAYIIGCEKPLNPQPHGWGIQPDSRQFKLLTY